MSRPKEIDRKDIKKLVLKKSKELFLKYGYNIVTMRKIASEIGYSPAATLFVLSSKMRSFMNL